MESAVKEIVCEEIEDISKYQITTHAIYQYMTKCFSEESLIETVLTMRRKMQKVKRVTLNKRERNNAVAYLDEEGIIYITVNEKVITAYPNEKIFKAKALYTSKQTGRKYR